MSNQLEQAQQGVITPEVATVAAAEGQDPAVVRDRLAAGQIVIPLNSGRQQQVVGIGRGLASKVNASIGTSTSVCDVAAEVAKARAAAEAGADTLMELSVGGDLDLVRREVLAAVDLPVGNVPLYQAFAEAEAKHGHPNKMDPEELFDLIERQCADGLSFMAIHCGINRGTLERLERQGYRYGGLVSKGGASMVAWMIANNRENPLYEQFDRVADILGRYDVVLSLGNGFRAGAIHDSADRAMIQELVINCELAELGRKQGCQMMVEGPGHVALDEIEANIILEKRMSGGAPYYMLGPLPTDVGAGYDHVVAAIGAAQSSRYGADLICYITPAEHLGLPTLEDVVEGVKVCRLAVHIGDLAKYPDRRERDRDMSRARRDMNWQAQFAQALFPDDARRMWQARNPDAGHECSMCGKYCANRGASQALGHMLEGSAKA